MVRYTVQNGKSAAISPVPELREHETHGSLVPRPCSLVPYSLSFAPALVAFKE